MPSPAHRAPVGVWIDRLVAVALILNLGWITWHLGGYLAGSMAISFPVLMTTLAVAVARWTLLEPTALPRGWWWPLPMLAYVALHMGGLAQVPGRAWLDGLLWFWMAAAYWCGLQVAREPMARRICGVGVAALTVLVAALAIYQRVVDPAWLPMGRRQAPQFLARSGGAFGVPNTMAAWMLIVLPPALIGCVGRGRRSRLVRVAAGGLVALAMLALVLSVSRGAWLAWVGVLLVWPLAERGLTGAARLRRVAIVVVGIGGIGAGAWAMSPEVRNRVSHLLDQKGELTRPILWNVAWRLWESAPVGGTGGGSYASLFDRERPVGFRDYPTWAHNDYLNTLSDYGVIGFGLSFGLAGVVTVWLVRRRGGVKLDASSIATELRWRGAVGLGLLGFAVATVVDFHLKIPAAAMLASLAAAGWISPVRERRFRGGEVVDPQRGTWAVMLGLGFAVGALWLGWAEARPRYLAEGWRFEARARINRQAAVTDASVLQKEIKPGIALLQQAVEVDPGNERAWSDLSYALSLSVHWEPAQANVKGVEAEQAARRALTLSPAVAEHWVRLSVALDLQNRWKEAGSAISSALGIAPNSSVVWYYQGFHLSLQRSTRLIARAALATALRLDPGNREAKALLAALERS
ncbi:O-antigen ligase family protein [Synoicihabitans lomoniglobus]|uniref:O-antigen ligase family protein n=1 Tax=Synoicihabitans lomoniglobus TaxID=2909285 RepID=A0AAF0CPZ5_9BACT|nr:O-antigen ligase family protein [Opitutaceae bacterium LMO-M01]WED65936.1 O-antigen ligase family protein [Opitutaceae bacterium LMO-M01]